MKLDHHRGGVGEPLVLIHGVGHTWRGWKPMLPLLERDFDVLAVDLPGFGRSASLPAGTEPTPEALADAVERAMDAAGFGRAVLCGNSLGGWIALELARRGRAGPVVARPWRLDPDDFAEVLRLFAEAPGFLDTLPHTFGGQPKGLDQIDVPVTILWGTRDLLLLPRQAKRFERLIPNAELRYLDGLGHTPMSDDPELLAELIATTSRGRRAEAPA